MSHLKLATFNLENLFLVAMDPEISRTTLKSEEKTNKLSKTIKKISPDVMFVCEIGGLDSLKKFNSEFLGPE